MSDILQVCESVLNHYTRMCVCVLVCCSVRVRVRVGVCGCAGVCSHCGTYFLFVDPVSIHYARVYACVYVCACVCAGVFVCVSVLRRLYDVQRGYNHHFGVCIVGLPVCS